MLEIDDVSRVFATKSGSSLNAIETMSVSIAEGEFVSIVGPSGCGKSTLLRIIGGLLRPSGGSVMIREKEVTAPLAEVGVVFQSPVLFPWKTVQENLLFPVELHRRVSDLDQSAAAELLDKVGLTGFEGSYPFELSGGMQQRAAIAAALVTDPAVLLMDEPFGALDAMTREDLNVELNRLWREQAKTVVLVTHDIQEAVFLSNRVLIMTPRPGRLAGVTHIPFEPVRTKQLMSDPRFAELCGDVRQVLTAMDAV